MANPILHFMGLTKRNGEMPKVIFADTRGMIHFNCPSCGYVSVKPVGQIFNMPRTQHISCVCGNTYEVEIERRKSFRKKTHLEGFYARATPAGSFEQMTIVDISLGGCHLITSKKHSMGEGDRVKLVFELDNAKRTKIERDAIVCNVDGQSIRCKFVATATGLDPDLGFYLRVQ